MAVMWYNISAAGVGVYAQRSNEFSPSPINVSVVIIVNSHRLSCFNISDQRSDMGTCEWSRQGFIWTILGEAEQVGREKSVDRLLL